MKLQFRQIEAFVKKPDPAARAILVYGPESGLMKERAAAIGKSVVADLNDPFNAVTLNGARLVEDPARLMDEALAMSMMGGSRLIRIEDAADSLAPLLKDYLQNPSTQNLVILEAGELGPKSPLRLLFEKSEHAAALPCYVEDERDVASVIRDTLKQENLAIEADALSFLSQALTGDRLRARGEIEKLIVYKGKEQTPISLEDVIACTGDTGAQSLDVLVGAVAGSKTEAALKAWRTLSQEGVPVIVIVRSLQNHFRRLHLVKARMQAGEPLDLALKTLQPPIFFKQEPAFRSQLNSWSMGGLAIALQKLSALEAQCKTTGMPDETLCSQALLSLSRRAA